jgi:UDP-glucuronate 4-epimerase
MKILVTGAAGFIGFHLVKQLLERNDDVVGLDNINDYYDVSVKYGRLLETGIRKEQITECCLIKSLTYNNYFFVKANLEDKLFIHQLFENEKFDVVINLAAQAGVRYSLTNPDIYIKSNIEGFLNILEGCRHTKVKNFIYASSSSIYGSNTKNAI